MAKRKFIDWDSVEPLYRLGKLSNCEICRQYAADHEHSQTWKTTVTEAAIRLRAKAKGWERNLADRVRTKVKENLVRTPLRDSNQEKQLSDQEIIDKAAEIAADVVLRHREEIKALLNIENALLEELSNGPKKLYLSTFQGEILEKEVSLTVKEKSATLKDLAAVRAQRVTLERQAYNLNDNSNPDEDLEGVVIEFVGVKP